jgi:hypothetical protein
MHCPLDCTLSKDFIQNLIIDSLCDNTALLYPKLSNLSFIKNNFCPIIKPDSCFSLLKRYDRHDLKTHFYSSSSNTSGSPSASVSSAVPSNWNFSLTFAYNGDKIGQGRENAKTYLRENPLVCEEVEAKVREKFQLDGTAEETDAEGEPEVLEDEE